jgi:hypothetical protein
LELPVDRSLAKGESTNASTGCWIARWKKPTIAVGRRARPRRGTSGVAIPPGSPISPLLADIYMRRFVLGWKMFGLERTLGTRLVTYADDLAR